MLPKVNKKFIIIFLKKSLLILLLYCIVSIHSYGPTNPYAVPVWKNRDNFEKNEIIYSRNVYKPSHKRIDLPSFAVVPDILFNSISKFDYHREYSSKLSLIYGQYLKKTEDIYAKQCDPSLRDPSVLSDEDFDEAFSVADQQIRDYEIANQQYLSTDPRGFNFSAYIFVANLHSKYNEFTTEYLTRKKCINKYNTALFLPSLQIPPNNWNNNKYCHLNKPDSHNVICDPNVKYSRIDGRCNNVANSNWGRSFHCHRRLLPPDYADGIVQPRASLDGSPLPSPRLITEILMPDLELNDPKLTSMNMMWGQFLVHDVFRTIQYLGLAIDCCRSPNQLPHPECIPITNFPPNRATAMFNQRCINTIRSTACNTCSLGPRDQMNVATPVLDLSNVYGGNLMNNSFLLRSFVRGQLRGSVDIKGGETLPIRNLPQEQDTLDLTACNEPLNRPELTCFHSGDGIRANQNPGVNSLHVVMHRRHNQHSEALSRVNPHWDDETLFQESRKLLIAEANKIHFGEYLPSILGERLMAYFDLNLEDIGYTKYNPNLDPSTIQSVGVAALRMGHSQISSLFRVLSNSLRESYSFNLRDKFFDMSDIWLGNANGIIRGLIEDPNRNVDPFVTTDVKDFLLFNPRTPRVTDLPAININRGRDHGVPAYVYYLEYCTGIKIKNWRDLNQFIPPNKVNKLRSVYRHYKDIDLFIGGLSEVHLVGSILGPTFACLNGIQFYHWKYGDRFYFEHGGEAGSFTLDQLNNIRQTTSLANLLCKTTDIEDIQMNVMFISSKSNPKILCHSFPEIDYELWRETKVFYDKFS